MYYSGTLYPYQKEILDVFERERKRWDKKIHIVAPPGSGKTIIGLEIISRLNTPTLILVPNLTLQEQWKDKLERFFLEPHESSEEFISTNINDIKKINIITYQSLSWSDDPDMSVEAKILDLWYQSEKDEFESQEIFLSFVTSLKIENPNEYRELYGKNRKKLKESGDSKYTRKLMKWSIHEYIARLRSFGVQGMIVDEAHHLTAWWSHVLHEIWLDLWNPYIIGLTATPPFESTDYFELDESYTELLWSVDYYIPTPAIVKSGRLAPYSDLVYVVNPGNELSEILSQKEKLLQDFIEIHKNEICNFLHEFLKENYSRLEVKSLDLLEKWMRFIYVYKTESIDMSTYITANARKSLTLEDIAKSIGKWWADGFKKSKNENLLSEIKTLFFNLGYIWRGANLYRFQTPIEKWLIYSKSKITGVQAILDKEIENLWDHLRCAIITDFLDVDSDWINGHSIFNELIKTHSKLDPYLISGQWIWRLEKWEKILTNETILSATERLSRWEIKLIIGTRGILGEWWDCPEVNTLIDLTWVSAYMSVNQVHGRAIRLNPNNLEKVANIYDIVCLGNGFQGMRDFERLEKKHSQFYGVDDSGLIIKWLDHIYPQLEKNITSIIKINNYTLKKSWLRNMIKELWWIGGEYKNEEVFSLSIEIIDPYEIVPMPSNVSWWQLRKIKPEKWKTENRMELGKSTYHLLVRTWIREMLDATLQVMKPYDMMPWDFSYDMKWSPSGSISISSNYKDPLISKKFIETISWMFGPITDEKYALDGRSIQKNTQMQNKRKSPIFQANKSILFIICFFPFSIIFFVLALDYDNIFVFFWGASLPFLMVYIVSNFMKIPEKVHLFFDSLQYIANTQLNEPWNNFLLWNFCGIPNLISSNDEKRLLFMGKKYWAIPEKADWYKKMWSYSILGQLMQNDKYSNNEHLTEKIKWTNFYRISWTLIIIVLTIRVFFHNPFPSIFGSLFSLLSILIGIFICCILLLVILRLLLSFIHMLYIIYAKIYNFFKRRKVIRLNWEITPVSQSDIGKPSFLSAKIEKLWI